MARVRRAAATGGAGGAGTKQRAGSLLQRTIEAIGRSIVFGEIPAGTVLPVEADLAARYGVGRNVVREAVKVLGEKQLLRTERRAGTTVLGASDWNHLDHEIIVWTLENPAKRDELVDELSALRLIIEPEAAALAAECAGVTETLRLFEALEQMEERANDEARAVEADILFHQRLFEATHNKLLLSLVRTVAVVLQANFALAIKVKQDIPQYLVEHRRVAEAVHRRDAAEARAVMRELLLNNARHLAEMRAALADRDGAQGASRHD